MGSHARWRVAATAATMGAVASGAAVAAPVAGACSTAAPCYASEAFYSSSTPMSETLALLNFQAAPTLASYTSGERTTLGYKAEMGPTGRGFLEAGATVGGPLVASPYNASTPVYYKRSQVYGSPMPSIIETNWTDGPGTGQFLVDFQYDTSGSCWVVSVGPHTSPCLGPWAFQPFTLTMGLNTNATSGYKAQAKMWAEWIDGFGSHAWWAPLPTGGGPFQFHTGGGGALCTNYDPSTTYSGVAVGALSC
jgi:hypothetical protein